ncbi:hypothetical protein G6F32_014234 [Rhizopus arrhizus]|nr:hypothetical protein G6F32_014234 [Rhizopus arrhizus]
MFRRTLRDHHHRHLRLAQGGEHALGGTRHANQAGAFQVQQGQAGAQGQALHRPARRALGADARARMRRLEGVADEDRQPEADGR